MTVSIIGVGVSRTTPVYLAPSAGISYLGFSGLPSVVATGSAGNLNLSAAASLSGLVGTNALGTLSLNLSSSLTVTGLAGTGTVGTLTGSGPAGANLDLSVANSSGNNMILLGVP